MDQKRKKKKEHLRRLMGVSQKNNNATPPCQFFGPGFSNKICIKIMLGSQTNSSCCRRALRDAFAKDVPPNVEHEHTLDVCGSPS